jgi:hypothetical protein
MISSSRVLFCSAYSNRSPKVLLTDVLPIAFSDKPIVTEGLSYGLKIKLKK